MGEEIQDKKTLSERVKCMRNVSITVAVLAMLVASAGLAVGVYGIAQFQALSKKMDEAKKGVPTAVVEDNCIESDDGEEMNCTKPAEDVEKDLLVADSDYVYIGEWGVKIKVVDGTFGKLSYNYVADGNGETVYFNGVISGASVSEPGYFKTDNSLVAVSRVKGEGAGTKIYSDGEYNFYVSNTQSVYSTNATEQEIEKDSMNKLKEILSNKENYSKF